VGLIKQVIQICQIIYREAEKEWLDEDKYMEALNELYEKFQQGIITEEEYDEEEELILEQLRVIRQYKKEHYDGGE